MSDSNDQLSYFLEVIVPDQLPRELAIIDQLFAGLDPRNDIILIDHKVQPKHYCFTLKNNCLSLLYLGKNGASTLNNLLLIKDKIYILEKGDFLIVGKTKINIHLKPKAQIIELDIIQPQKPKEFKKAKTPFFIFSLLPFHIYSILADIIITYLTLAFIIPSLNVLPKMNSLLWSSKQFFPAMPFQSLFDFFIIYNFLMVVSALLIAMSPADFLIGLNSSYRDDHFLIKRMKALMNVLIFPRFFYKTLSDDTMKKLSRRVLVPALLFFSIISPFFLSTHFTKNITYEKTFTTKTFDVHTNNIQSYSKSLDLALDVNLNEKLTLLPSFHGEKMDLILYDLENNNFLEIKENARYPINQVAFLWNYANPLASFKFKSDQVTNSELKKMNLKSFDLSLSSFASGISDFGPFLINVFLFKDFFLQHFKSDEPLLINSFNQESPVLKISTSYESKVFWFGKNEVIEFSLISPTFGRLNDHFSNSVLAGLSYEHRGYYDSKNPQILEIFDAYQAKNSGLILTYYINEAKKVQASSNLKWRTFFLSNLKQTKLALNGMNKNFEKSFDDIISSIK